MFIYILMLCFLCTSCVSEKAKGQEHSINFSQVINDVQRGIEKYKHNDIGFTCVPSVYSDLSDDVVLASEKYKIINHSYQPIEGTKKILQLLIEKEDQDDFKISLDILLINEQCLSFEAARIVR